MQQSSSPRSRPAGPELAQSLMPLWLRVGKGQAAAFRFPARTCFLLEKGDFWGC